MSYKLADLLSDFRLERLFSLDKRPCALQLWILRLQNQDILESRLIYGRLVPYSFFNNSWSFSNKDNFQSFGSYKASLTQLNLYIDSSLCSDFLHMICEGQSIDNISKVLKLNLPENLSKQYGNTTLINKNTLFKPVAYLLNRDAYISNLLLSPHGSAGALSASISISDKQSLFFYEGNYNRALTLMILNQLNTDTGMDFGGTDIDRLGDIELLVFPTLDDHERNLLRVERDKDTGLNVQFTSTQLSAFNHFQFHLTIENNGQVLSSKIAVAQAISEEIFEYNFELDEKLFKITDSTKIDIFAFKTENCNEGYLCCSWKINYIREVNFQMHLIGQKSNPVKFDWLENTTNSKMIDRVSEVLSLSTKNNISKTQIGGREIDSWVHENQVLKELFSKLNPPATAGRFFPRCGKSNGEGKLQFVEWFKELVEKNTHYHIAIFDPYFEDVGLSLLTLCASPNAEYTVFRTIPKVIADDIPKRGKSDSPVNTGIDNLIANCEHNRKLLQRSNVKIYGLKEGRLHDRYILVIGQYGLPIEGFHLSNSFQKATENFPLLVTPIPTDVLYKTNQFTFDLIQEANTFSTGRNESRAISVLFDSKSLTTPTKLYEPLSILKNTLAGAVLSVWLEQPSLKGLSGNELKNKMIELEVIQNESLYSLSEEGLFRCLDELGGEFSNFIEIWEVIGTILAHTMCGNSSLDRLRSETNFLLFLSDFLSCSFQRKPVYDENAVSVIDPSYFKKTLRELLKSSTQVHHFRQSTKYSIVTWAEFYTVKYLWLYAPELLIAITEKEVKNLTIESQSTDVVKLSLLGQIFSEVSIDLEFREISGKKQKLLIESKIPLMKWFGWKSLEQDIQSVSNSKLIVSKLSCLTYDEKIQFIGWSLNRNNKSSKNQNLSTNLVSELYNLLPEKIPNKDLELFMEFVRGHMHKLGWAEPWLFRDIIEPLLTKKRLNFEDVCEIWFKDLIDLLNQNNSHDTLLFSSEREGQTTNISAYLWAYSNQTYQEKCLHKLSIILNKQKRIIQQPLASTLNWSRWDKALKVSLWILTLAKLCKYYLSELKIREHYQLTKLLEESNSLAMVRPSNEWSSEGELFLYLGRIEEMLADLEQA